MREADVDLGSGTVIDAGEELDVKKADRSVWLVKVPTFVKNVWTAAVAKPTYLGEAAGLATGSGTHLGTVCLAFDPTAKVKYHAISTSTVSRQIGNDYQHIIYQQINICSINQGYQT